MTGVQTCALPISALSMRIRHSRGSNSVEELIDKGHASSDPEKQAAADNLKQLLGSILASDDHRWFAGKMTPQEKAARESAAKSFKKRYE